MIKYTWNYVLYLETTHLQRKSTNMWPLSRCIIYQRNICLIFLPFENPRILWHILYFFPNCRTLCASSFEEKSSRTFSQWSKKPSEFSRWWSSSSEFWSRRWERWRFQRYDSYTTIMLHKLFYLHMDYSNFSVFRPLKHQVY